VVLQIRQETSDVVVSAGEENPTFAQRVVNSTVAVQSGQAVAIAGLIEENSNFAKDGIPLLSRIPVLGSAFGTTIEDTARTELLVLIRPLVVRDQADAQAATLELQTKLQNLSRPAGLASPPSTRRVETN
ncbi:MAG: type II secretion system protein GspD, partial [Pseudomonadota bacterium]